MNNEDRDTRVELLPKSQHGDLPRTTATGDVPTTLDALLSRLHTNHAEGYTAQWWMVLSLCEEAKKLKAELENRRQQVARLTADADILHNCAIIEIAVANKSGSVSDYMNHWEGRALKAEREVERLRAEGAPPAPHPPRN